MANRATLIEPRTANEIIAFYADRPLPDEARNYLQFHAHRYASLLRCVDGVIDQLSARSGGRPLNLLDVGPAFQTELLITRVTEGHVDTLGAPDQGSPGDPRGRHIPFDLNEAGDPGRWPDLDGYDIVVMAEVIEHLWAGPLGVLGCLARGLVPGGMLIVQTPNAVALHKRIRFLLGQGAIAPLPEANPGTPHLHEYTFRELLDAGRRTGLHVSHVEGENYFGASTAAKLYRGLGKVLPLRLRHGMTVTFQTPINPGSP